MWLWWSVLSKRRPSQQSGKLMFRRSCPCVSRLPGIVRGRPCRHIGGDGTCFVGPGRYAQFQKTMPWLWRSVVNAARNERRKRSEVFTELDGDRVHEPASGDDGRVAAALEALPERQRLILFLRYYGDLDYRRIAEILGLSTGTVAATIHQAQRSMRRRLAVTVDD
jgi:DNA-binding CsgD family transcriptional regulator